MKKSPSLKWIIWSFAAIFYLYEFFLRVAPSVMISDLMRTFAVDATAIGFLSAFYFYLYAPLQLPVGVLTDRYGARKLLAIASLSAGIGTLLFGLAPSFVLAAFGRLLIGFGSSFGFVCMIYICSHWFEAKRRGILIGLANTIGMLGAILGQGPLRLSINQLGWRSTNYLLAIFGILLGFLIYLIVRDDPKKQKSPSKPNEASGEKLWSGILLVCRNKYSWLNALVGLFFYVSTATFAGLWGIPFVHDVYKVSVEKASFIISMVFVGWAVGGPLIGLLSDKIREKKRILVGSNLIGALLMLFILYATATPAFLLYLLFFLVGFISSAQLLNFTYAIDINPQTVKGTATAFTNFIVVVGTACLQPLVGKLLDINWTGAIQNGVRIYDLKAYNIAMATFPLCFFIAFVLALFLKQMPTHTLSAHKAQRLK